MTPETLEGLKEAYHRLTVWSARERRLSSLMTTGLERDLKLLWSEDYRLLAALIDAAIQEANKESTR